MNSQPGTNVMSMNGQNSQETRRPWKLILGAAIVGTFFLFATNKSLLIMAGWFVTAWIAGIAAADQGRSRLTAVLLSIFLPIIGPLIVLFQSDRSRKHPGAVVLSRLTRTLSLFSNVQVRDEQLLLTPFPGFFGGKTFPLADLRLLYVIVPGNFKWRLTSSSQTMQYIPIDLLEEAKFTEFNNTLIETVRTKSAAGIQLVVGDYRGNGAIINLSRLGRDTSVLEAIARTRSRRLETMRNWMKGNPRVILQTLALTTAGIERGKYHRPWNEIDTFQTFTQNGIITSLTAVLSETKRNRLTGKERHLTEQLIYALPPSRKEWYSAELFFWMQWLEQKTSTVH